MRKLKLFFACLLMAVLSIGQMWADPAPVGTTLFSEDFSGYAADDVPDGTEAKATGRVVYGGAAVAYSVTNGGSTTKIYNQNLATGTAPEILVGKNSGTLVIAGIPSGGAQAITVSYKQNKQKLKVEASGANYSGSNEIKPSAEGTQTFDITVADGAAATFTLIFTCTGSSNVRVDDILVTVKTAGEGGGSDPVAVTGVSLDETAISLAVGETQTLTATVAPNNATVKTVSWSSSDESVATVDGGVVTAVAEGTATITVASTEDATKKATCAVTVTAAPAASNWQVIAPENLATGDVVVLTMLKNSIYYAAPNNGSGAPAATVVAVTNDKLSNTPAETLQWTVTVVAEGQYQFSVGTNYLKCSDTNNGVRVGAVGDDEYNTFDINTTNAKQYLHTTATMTSAANGRYLGIYNTQDWRCYTSVNNNIKEGTLVIFKEFDNRAATGLNFETEQYLIKKNATFSAPELINPNSLPVTYLSSNTDIAEVAANGAITIKADAIGAATITASFAGDENYKDGSASYTIFVAEQAGTDTNPLTEATAKALIDLGCTANAHVAGTVASQHTSYFTVTLSDGFQFYNLKDLGNVAFENAYLVAGDQVIAYGQLLKYNSTYELATGCYLTSYTHPTSKTPIVSDIDNPITVAAAIGYLNDPTTYDLSQDVWVRGVVTNIGQTNGASPIPYIDVKDANAENSFRFYNYTVNSSITEDPQQYDILIATGKLDKHNTTYELNGCEVVDLVRPDVAVTSVELDQDAASIEVNETVTLHAIVNPDNASNKAITWSVQSGSDYASVDAGVVTGNAEGEAVIRAASTADPTKYAECTVTVTAVDPTVHHVTFIAGTDKSDETSITKDGITISATTFNNDSYYQCYANSAMTVSSTVGNITKIELTCTTEGTAKYGPGNWDFTGYSYSGANGSWTGSAETVEFGNASQQVRMTLITVTYKEDTRADANLAWDPADDIELTVGDAFSAPALVKPNDITVANITIASNNPDLATVTEGVVSLVENATGEATITATFTGDEKYKPATISYTITVSVAPLTDYYQKVTETAGIVEGTYLIVYEDGENSLAFNGGLETLDAESNTIAVTITNDNKIGVTTETAAATFYIDPAAGTVKSASDHYIGVSSWSNGLKQTDTYVHNVLEIDGDGNAQVGIYNADWNTTGGTMRLQYNKSAGQTRFRYYKNGGQQPIALYKLANEVVKASPELTWSAESVELTVGDDFTSPTFTHADGLTKTITFSSDKESVATVDANGVISLVADATGTAHITASYPGDANFKAENAVCTIKVNPAHSIYVSPSLTVNFGSVVKDASVDDKVINVTLTEVPNATATLGGDNPEVFSINPASPAALTASGDITISASSATAGVFEAKLTISDDAGLATSRVVTLKLTVTDPAAEETPISTTSKWVAATAADLVDGAEVIIIGIKDEVVYAMGEQKNTNRAACIATVDGEGVLTPGEGTMSFTLVAQETEGVFALRTSDGKFLYAAKNDANHLKTQDEVDVNAKWTLSVTSAVATGSSNRNVMQFNGSSATNKLFSCYASASQSAIQFYVPKPVTPVDPTPDYTRTVEINRYGTICLPKAGVIEGAKLYDIDYYDEASTLYLLEVNGNAMVAGRPYIFLPSATSLEVFYTDDADEDAGTYRGLVGSYSEKTILVNDGNYILYENAYYLVNSTARVGANRAYIHMESVPTTPYQQQGAPRRRVAMNVYSEQTTTDIDALNASEAPVKMIIDGQLFIIRGEKMYNVNGQVVK